MIRNKQIIISKQINIDEKYIFDGVKISNFQ